MVGDSDETLTFYFAASTFVQITLSIFVCMHGTKVQRMNKDRTLLKTLWFTSIYRKIYVSYRYVIDKLGHNNKKTFDQSP